MGDIPQSLADLLRRLPARHRLVHLNSWRRAQGLVPLEALPTNGIRSHPVHKIKTDSDAGRFRESPPPKPPSGPGTHLKGLLAVLGFVPRDGFCQCNTRAAEMDRWGIEGVKARRDEVIAWLEEEAAKATWLDKIAAVARALVAGILINPADVCGSLVDEAVRRAEASLRASS